MPENTTWVDLAQVITAIFSTLTALIALWVAVRNNHRAREALKVQTYLYLRSRFLEIYRSLGHLDDAECDVVELKLTRQAYWHNAWDEWYITTRVAPSEFSSLWDGFFAAAVNSGYRHPALKATFEQLAQDTNAGFGAYAKEFIEEVRRSQGQPASQEKSNDS